MAAISILELAIGGAQHDDVGLAVCVAPISDTGGHAEAVPFSGIVGGRIPVVVLAKRRTQGKAVECWRVVAHGVAPINSILGAVAAVGACCVWTTAHGVP